VRLFDQLLIAIRALPAPTRLPRAVSPVEDRTMCHFSGQLAGCHRAWYRPPDTGIKNCTHRPDCRPNLGELRFLQGDLGHLNHAQKLPCFSFSPL
jgi:hypothetical protein